MICRELQSRLLSVWRREKLVSPTAYELAERLVEQNINLLRRQLTREEQLRVDGTCSKKELRTKGLCFTCKEPWGLDQSCLSDIEGMTNVD